MQTVHKLGQLLLMASVDVPQEPFQDLLLLLGRRISYRSNQSARQINKNSRFSDEVILFFFVFSFLNLGSVPKKALLKIHQMEVMKAC